MRQIAYIFLLIISITCNGQSKWAFTHNVNFGCNLTFNYGKGQVFPGARIFGSFTAGGVYKNHIMVNYGPSLSVYTRSLGANLNPLIGDMQVDFTNAFTIGYGWDDLSYTKYLRTFNNGSYYNLSLSKSYAFLLSTHFVLNNHKRNQILGSVTMSFPGVTLNYNNDGAAPFDRLPLADNFDRWWTGGIGVFVHNRKNYNTVELSFEQFTGYAPLLYEVSTMLGINMPSYNLQQGDSVEQFKRPDPAFNTSAYNIKIFMGSGYAIDLGAIGSLRTNSTGRVFGIQDIIHTMGGFALHPNNDVTRFYIGGTFNKLNHVKF